MEIKDQNKKGLVFVDFARIKKTKNNKNILIFISDKIAVSVSVKYLEKVLSSNNQLQDEAS